MQSKDFPCFRARHVQQQPNFTTPEQVLPRGQRQSHEDRLGARRQQPDEIGEGALVR